MFNQIYIILLSYKSVQSICFNSIILSGLDGRSIRLKSQSTVFAPYL